MSNLQSTFITLIKVSRMLESPLEGYNIKPGVMMASYLLQDKLAKQNIKADVMEGQYY